MARDLLVSGLLAYGVADLVKAVIGRERPAGLPVGAVLHEGAVGGAGFISGHAAVAAALATAAAPYLGRRSRRTVWVLAWAARSSYPFEAVDDRGRRCCVKVLDPDRFERDWLYRLLAARDIEDADAVAPLGQQTEHEAVAAMTARERGVGVPPVILARGSGRGAVVV